MSIIISSETDSIKISQFLHVNEQTQLPEVQMGNPKSVEIDLGTLESINSVGIRQWIKWVGQFPESCNLTLSNCPKIFLDVALMVAGVIPKNSKFGSIKAPYYCSDCDDATTEQVILDIRNIPDIVRCANCQANAELDLTPKACQQLQEYWKYI